MNIGEHIRIARQNAGLSQSQVAQLCGLDPSTISFFEANKRTPIVRNILKLAEALNVTTDELLGCRDIAIRVVPCDVCNGTGRIVTCPN